MNNETIQNLRRAGFIVKLQGKEFVLFAGLQVLARELGLKSIETELISIDKEDQITTTDDKTTIIKATGLTIFKATVIGNEGYGPAEAIGDDVDCDGAWALKRRVDPSIKGVHRTPDGATARFGLDFSSRAMSWNGQREFTRMYEVFNRRAENDRLKSIMSR